MEEDLNFGVFYTCFTEVSSVKYALELLLKIYPSVRVYLVSDGGSDYSFLQTNNIKTLLEEDSLGIIPKINKDEYKNEYWQNLIKKAINTYLDRVYRAIQFCGTKYLLVMEPDVIVRGKIHMPENAKIAGSRVNEGFSEDLRNIIRSVSGSVDNNNWGAMPALYETEAFLKVYNRIKTDIDLFNKLCLSDCRFANYDFFTTVMFNLLGYDEIFNPELTECLRNPCWRDSWHPLVHQFRYKYPTKEIGYAGRHAN